MSVFYSVELRVVVVKFDERKQRKNYEDISETILKGVKPTRNTRQSAFVARDKLTTAITTLRE